MSNFKTDEWAKPPVNLFSDDRSEIADDVTRALPHAVGPEKSLLSSMLQDPEEFIGLAIEAGLSESHFYLPNHATIYSVLVEMQEAGQEIEFVGLVQGLLDSGRLVQCGGPGYFSELYTYSPSPGHFQYHLQMVKDKYLLRQMIRLSNATVADAYENPEDPSAVLENVERGLMEIREGTMQATEEEGNKKAMARVMENFRRSITKEANADAGILTGFADFDRMTGGLRGGEMIVVAARPSMGKALRMEEPIKTMDGWKLNKYLRVGDEIASPTDGRSFVTGVFPQGIREMVEVEFSDGRKIKCDKDHLWQVFYRDWSEPRIYKASKVAEMLGRVRYKNRLWINTPDGNYGHSEPLPIDPWMLGALIGNGGYSSGSLMFSSNDEETLELLRSKLPAEISLKYTGKYDYRASVPKGQKNPMIDAFRELGIWGTKSIEKSIPEIYLTANRNARIELMRGLMDTDGNVEKSGSMVYSTSSEMLALQVQSLARSLGALCTISTRLKPKFTHKGEDRTGSTAYRLYISHPNAAEFVTLTRKRERVNFTRKSRLTFKAIIETEPEEAQCISVSHPQSLYIASRDYIVTHNTSFMMNIVENVCIDQCFPTLVFSAEMSKDQLLDRLAFARAKYAKCQISRGYTPKKQELERIRAASNQIVEAPLFIDDTSNPTISELRAKARRMVRTHGIRFIAIDYLQLLKALSKQAQGSREREIAEISGGIKALAKDLNVPILILAQLNRDSEKRTGKAKGKPRMSDLRESGAIEQDADIVGLLTRAKQFADDEMERQALVGRAELIIAKNRNGETGSCPLTFIEDLMRFETGPPYEEEEEESGLPYNRKKRKDVD